MDDAKDLIDELEYVKNQMDSRDTNLEFHK